MHAAPVVFDQVNDFHNWEAWSPWAKLDPAVRNSLKFALEVEGFSVRTYPTGAELLKEKDLPEIGYDSTVRAPLTTAPSTGTPTDASR